MKALESDEREVNLFLPAANTIGLEDTILFETRVIAEKTTMNGVSAQSTPKGNRNRC